MSLDDLTEELAFYRTEKNEKGVANAAFKIGDYHIRKGAWEKSLEFFQEALSICRDLENRQGD